MHSLKTTAIAAALVAGLFAAGGLAMAEEATVPVDPEAATGDKALHELLAKENDARKACETGMFSGQFVAMVNQFVEKTCDEVKNQIKN